MQRAVQAGEAASVQLRPSPSDNAATAAALMRMLTSEWPTDRAGPSASAASPVPGTMGAAGAQQQVHMCCDYLLADGMSTKFLQYFASASSALDPVQKKIDQLLLSANKQAAEQREPQASAARRLPSTGETAPVEPSPPALGSERLADGTAVLLLALAAIGATVVQHLSTQQQQVCATQYAAAISCPMINIIHVSLSSTAG